MSFRIYLFGVGLWIFRVRSKFIYNIYIYIFRAGSGFIWGWFGIYLGWVLGLFRNGVALSKGCFKV